MIKRDPSGRVLRRAAHRSQRSSHCSRFAAFIHSLAWSIFCVRYILTWPKWPFNRASERISRILGRKSWACWRSSGSFGVWCNLINCTSSKRSFSMSVLAMSGRFVESSLFTTFPLDSGGTPPSRSHGKRHLNILSNPPTHTREQ